ncbi:WXG100 family type VII secretion target [Streptomyces antibioticus]
MVDRKLNDGDVQKLQTEVIDRYDNIRGSLAKLQGTIDMIEKAWTGQGANAFNTKQTEINTHMVSIGKMLDDFLEGINLNKTDKRNLEDQIEADLTKISVEDLGGKTSALNSYWRRSPTLLRAARPG